MKITSCHIKDLLIIEPLVFEDDRGYFFESFNLNKFKEHTGLNPEFIQDNESKSVYGTLRGIHFQTPPFQQAKLVRAVSGKLLDVVVDLRSDSESFGKWHSELLTENNKKQLYIPRGFGHGFVVMSESAVFSYKVDNYYSKDHDTGIYWNDEQLNIDWQISYDDLILSEKDKNLQNFHKFCELKTNWSNTNQ